MLTEGWVYGLDVNSSCIGIGLVEIGSQAWRTHGCPWRVGWREKSLSLPHSLRRCRRSVRDFLMVLAQDFPAASCAIERPAGPHPNPSLMAHWGVVTEAAYDALGVAPWFYKGASEWRKQLGLPNTKIAALQWAVAQGFDLEQYGDDQAEGLGVAAAGMLHVGGRQVRELALVPWSPLRT